MKRRTLFVVIGFIFLISNILFAQQNKLMTPEEFLGFKVGADFKLARWEQIIKYFNIVDDFSDRVIVRELGKSTEGNPFIMAVISDPQTISNREKYKLIQKNRTYKKVSNKNNKPHG